MQCMRNKIGAIALCLGLVICVSFFVYKRATSSSGLGTVIILNGPSASGKSSIQKAFQALMLPSLWIKLGVDNLFDNPMPDISLENMSYWQKENDIRYVVQGSDADNNSVIALHVGKQGQNVVEGMNSAIAAYAKAGCNVIVDYIAYDQLWLADLQKKLDDAHIKTLYVKVDIPLQVLEQREKARGTSPVGHARSHYNRVYGTVAYDMTVCPAQYSAQEIAEQIQNKVRTMKTA